MEYKELENQIEFLLSAALKKCGNIQDAEDLAQDTLISALSYTAKGNVISDMRAWLITVLNFKWNDTLRKKYRQPIIGIGDGFDIIDEDNDLSVIEKTEEAESVRKAVAYLSKIYREVIVRHYMNGQSIAQISCELGIPEGTVKSRLHIGRTQLKEGIVNMENYSKQSYQPITLSLYNSGNNGRNNEPQSLIRNNLLAQNILWAAYEKPITAEEIAKAIGTPTAYVESVIDTLTSGELMKRLGNRFYTDFMITTAEDEERFISEQKRFVIDHFYSIWNPIRKGLDILRNEDYYKRCTFDEKNSFEMYFAFNCLDYGIYNIFCGIYNEEQNFPYRRDGGRWIAFGNVSLNENTPQAHTELLRHTYTGERFTHYENYATSKILRLHVYGADGFPNYKYYHSADYYFLKEGDDVDDILTRLLYIIHKRIDPDLVGFNTEYFKSVPHLKKCKILREENNKLYVNIPIIDDFEYDRLYGILTEVKRTMCEDKELSHSFAEFIKDKKQKIPSHLSSVPLHKQYLYSNNAMQFAAIREAMTRGELYDGHYDDDSNGINQHPCPMFLVIE